MCRAEKLIEELNELNRASEHENEELECIYKELQKWADEIKTGKGSAIMA